MSDDDNDHKYEGIWSFIVLIFIILICGAIISYNILVNATPGKAIGGSIAAIILFVLIWVLGLVGGARYWPNAENSCHENPCLHDGKCNNEYWDGYNCTCTGDWSGDNCDEATDVGLSKRPCHNNPCYHDAKCTDIDENADGIFEDYECECPEIKGLPGQHWDGVNCNDFPSSVTVDDYSKECFTDVGKTDSQKEYLKKCEEEEKCSDPNKMMMNCKHNCNDSLTHKWCKDNNTCVDRFNEDDVRECDSLWRDKREVHERHGDNRKKCEEDPSTKWDYHEHVCSCNSNLNCISITTSGECIDARCCEWNGSECSNHYNENHHFTMRDMENYYDSPRRGRRGGRGRHNNRGGSRIHNNRGGSRIHYRVGTERRNR